MRDEKLRLPSLIVRKSLECFGKQTRIGIIPTRKVDPNIFQITLKQDYIDAQYVKLPSSETFFPFSMFYCANEGKMFTNLIILNESTLLNVIHIKFRDLFVIIRCVILYNLAARAFSRDPLPLV